MNKFLLTIAAAAGALTGFAKIEMGAPFAEGAVLQRGMEQPVWGRAATGAVVCVSFAGVSARAKTDGAGIWRVDLPPLAACAEGRPMKVEEFASESSGETAADSLEIGDILVGEVWFASGQSNMECPIWGKTVRYRDGSGALVTAMDNLPEVRYVSVENSWSVEPQAQKAVWRKFIPADARRRGKALSAVAYYYARELFLALRVPIGIVSVNWGGTNIDAWTPRVGYEGCDPSIQAVAELKVKAKGEWTANDSHRPVTGPQQQPTVLWNGMVAAFAPMANRGFIWYQGCHNAFESGLYCAKLHALYNGWAKAFENPDLKMYLVALAPYNQNWMGIVSAQRKFAAEQKNAAIASTADVGNFDDIHPNRKEIVAKRLAVHALKRDYGFAIPCDDSPVLEEASFADGQATLRFANAQGFYVYSDKHSHDTAFELAGRDGVWAAAKIANFRKVPKGKDRVPFDTDDIVGDTIVLTSEKVPEPVRARYLGRDRTMGTIYNEVSLPLGPFVTK